MTAPKHGLAALTAAGVFVVAATLFAPAAEARARVGVGVRFGVPRPFVYVGAPYAFRPYWYGWAPYFAPDVYSMPGNPSNMAAAAAADLGAIDLDVKPNEAEVWVDGKYVADARHLDGDPSLLWLKEGTHHLELTRGGYTNFDETLDIHRGVLQELKVRLERGDSAPPRG